MVPPLQGRPPGYGFVDERTPELAIAVVPNARGKGVGSALLTRCSSGQAEGFAAISLSVDRHNRGAIALYEQYGFQQVGETRRLLDAAGRARVSTIALPLSTKG